MNTQIKRVKQFSTISSNILKQNIYLSMNSSKLNVFNKSFNSINRKYFSSDNKTKDTDKFVNITYKYLVDDTTVDVKAKIGENVLITAHENNVDLEGACECSLACSTCHVILEQSLFDKLPPTEEIEDDLLDLAFGLTHTSRLGCQVEITKEFEGAVISIPSYTKNLYVDGHKPKPH